MPVSMSKFCLAGKAEHGMPQDTGMVPTIWKTMHQDNGSQDCDPDPGII